MITNDLQHIAVDINTPILDPVNARHNHDLEAIAQSLDKYGQRKTIVVNKRTNFVLAGNGTLKAARSLGWKQIAVVWADDDIEFEIDAKIEPSLIFNRPQMQFSWPVKNTKIN